MSFIPRASEPDSSSTATLIRDVRSDYDYAGNFEHVHTCYGVISAKAAFRQACMQFRPALGPMFVVNIEEGPKLILGLVAESRSTNVQSFLLSNPELIPSQEGASTGSKIENAVAKLRSLCRNGDINTAVDICFEIVEGAFAQNNLSQIDELLVRAEPGELDSRVTVGMLRASSRAKQFLFAWSALLAKEQSRLQREGRNVKKVLRGLLPTHVDTTS